MAEQYQKHSHVIQAEGEWAERLRIRDKRAFAKEEAEWREMEARAQDKLQEDAIEAAGQMFDLAASNQPQDQLDEDQDNSKLGHTAIEDGDDPLNKKGAEENSGMAKVSAGFAATDHPINIPVPSNNHKAQGNIANKPSSLRNLGPRRSLEQATKSQATRLGPNSNSFPYPISQHPTRQVAWPRSTTLVVKRKKTTTRRRRSRKRRARIKEHTMRWIQHPCSSSTALIAGKYMPSSSKLDLEFKTVPNHSL